MSRTSLRINPVIRAIRLLSVLAAGLPLAVLAQDEVAEDTIIVTSPRAETALEDVASSISRVTQEQIQLGQQQLTLDESLVRVPGVFMQNRHNFSQALRISIRGFGARGNFGIRGIKVIVDDVPATLTDGQGNVDEIDLGSAQRIEVIRGPASSLYGSASAGVISVYSEDGQETPFVDARISGGEYGYEQVQLKTGGQAGRLNYLGSVSMLDYDGYRENSYIERNALNSKLRFDIGETSDFTATINVLDIPKMGDPGGLTAAELAANRRAANPFSRPTAFDNSEGRSQERVGLVYRNAFGENHEILVRNYYTWLDFENKLTVQGTVAQSNGGQVEFDRAFAGLGGQYTFTGNLGERRNRLIMGLEIEDQQDDRLRYQNLTGGIRGLLTFDQTEMVSSMGLFAQNEFSLSPTVDLILGLRYDDVEFEIEDHFLANTTGNDSGSSDFNETSERLGLLWCAADRAHVYANYSTAFDTPTTTEFANPAGGGFNPNLTSQVAESVEIGVRGEVGMRIPLSYDLAVFDIAVDDEIVLFSQVGGRSFFSNAAESTRKGFELALSAQLLDSFGISVAYSDLDATFDSFTTATTSFAGRTVPGVPKRQAFVEFAYRHEGGFYGIVDALDVSAYYADNANIVRIEAYTVSNLRLGYEGNIGNFELSPFIGIYNLMDEEFNSNIRINDANSRYYEPAPDRQAYGGLSARYNFR
jgi:iron complex outermembrane receptor protein